MICVSYVSIHRGCCFRKQYKKIMKSAKQFGTESTVMRPVKGGGARQMCQAYVVPREEILSNPAFADLRLREGLGEGTSGVSVSSSVSQREQRDL